MPWQNAASHLKAPLIWGFLLYLSVKKGRIKKVEYFIFKCPGCAFEHTVPIAGTGNDWQMTGSEENPTLEPSVLNYDFKMLPGGQQEKSNICHLFIRNGKIQYLSDCQHRLAGQTIDLPEIT